MKAWKLKRTAQCAKCPWRVDVDPHNIPDGYSIEKHEALRKTIADPHDVLGQLQQQDLQIMQCHAQAKAHCIGWLANQVGSGNNVALRLKMTKCMNADRVRLHGPQHPTFDATLPGGR